MAACQSCVLACNFYELCGGDLGVFSQHFKQKFGREHNLSVLLPGVGGYCLVNIIFDNTQH